MSDFTLAYDGFDPTQEGLREALTSTGNGYFATRVGQTLARHAITGVSTLHSVAARQARLIALATATRI